MTYNRLIQGLGLAGIEVDRRILADLAISEPDTFADLVAALLDAGYSPVAYDAWGHGATPGPRLRVRLERRVPGYLDHGPYQREPSAVEVERVLPAADRLTPAQPGTSSYRHYAAVPLGNGR